MTILSLFQLSGVLLIHILVESSNLSLFDNSFDKLEFSFIEFSSICIRLCSLLIFWWRRISKPLLLIFLCTSFIFKSTIFIVNNFFHLLNYLSSIVSRSPSYSYFTFENCLVESSNLSLFDNSFDKLEFSFIEFSSICIRLCSLLIFWWRRISKPLLLIFLCTSFIFKSTIFIVNNFFHLLNYLSSIVSRNTKLKSGRKLTLFSYVTFFQLIIIWS